VSGTVPESAFRATVKIRYKSDAYPAFVTPLGADRMQVQFDDPLRDITPGQGAVVYEGDRVVSGGIIEKAEEAV